MKLEEIALIAKLPAIEPAAGQEGKQLGFPDANAISAALDEAGYVVVNRSDLENLGLKK